MSFVNEELPASISKMCCQTGKITVVYTNLVKEDGVSILAQSKEVEMVLEGMDECLAKIAKAISRA